MKESTLDFIYGVLFTVLVFYYGYHVGDLKGYQRGKEDQKKAVIGAVNTSLREIFITDKKVNWNNVSIDSANYKLRRDTLTSTFYIKFNFHKIK